METRPPLPPFTEETVRLKVHLAEDGWSTRDAQRSPQPTRLTQIGATARHSSKIARRRKRF